MPMPQYSTMYT